MTPNQIQLANHSEVLLDGPGSEERSNHKNAQPVNQAKNGCNNHPSPVHCRSHQDNNPEDCNLVLPEERFDFVQFTSFHKDERAHARVTYDLVVRRLPIKEKPEFPQVLLRDCSVARRHYCPDSKSVALKLPSHKERLRVPWIGPP